MWRKTFIIRFSLNSRETPQAIVKYRTYCFLSNLLGLFTINFWGINSFHHAGWQHLSRFSSGNTVSPDTYLVRYLYLALPQQTTFVAMSQKTIGQWTIACNGPRIAQISIAGKMTRQPYRILYERFPNLLTCVLFCTLIAYHLRYVGLWDRVIYHGKIYMT